VGKLLWGKCGKQKFKNKKKNKKTKKNEEKKMKS
jgi:hypothetical protein